MAEPIYDDDLDDGFCANCGGEGFTYGCSWDWQCDTWDEGEGTCLCTRRCDWCRPSRAPTYHGIPLDDLARGESYHPGDDA